MVAVLMFMMVRDVIKSFGNYIYYITFRCSFGSHLKFKNGVHLDFKMAAVFNTFWTIISQLASYVLSSKWWQMAIPMFMMRRITKKGKKKKRKKNTWIVTGRCSLAAILNFRIAEIYISQCPTFFTHFGLYLHF